MAYKTKEARNKYIREYRARKKALGHYGKCKECDKPLGRNEHPDRPNDRTGYCSDCMTGDRHHNWTGGRRLNHDGYVLLRVSPKRVLLEHRVIMADHIGRELRDDETVHHKNGVRTDNRIENLELWVGAPTRGMRVTDAVSWAKEILRRYE